MITPVTSGELVLKEDESGQLYFEYEGASAPADEADIEKDTLGFTNPNLHRRFDIHEPAESSGELAPREYDVRIADKVHSYRTTTTFTHQEVGSDIP